ncbi:unnamed protein product [Polarella glacialis]|uniref:Uncharacterized protein n=1 Tax=Polarella glacialis TaxID=89957 RepID=A0A813H0K8_POLGL|nr:unnamed protein product [Polarella glacialis]CAE8690085.1 unnamed protein product [Polarella glacialis]
MVHYEVVSCAELGGALVREGRGLTTKQIARLCVGAVVSEEERAGERLRFKKVSGSGPEAGWVSATLLARVDKPKKAVASPAAFKGTSMFALAELAVMQKGPTAALQEGSAKGKDAAALLLVAVAHLADGRASEAAAAALEAQTICVQAGKQEGEASAILALALAKLMAGESREALNLATSALALFKEVGDKQMEASSLSTIANARLALKEINVAESAVKEALNIFRIIGDTEGEQAAQITFHDVCLAKGGRDKAAQSVAEERIAYCKSTCDKKGEGEALQKLVVQQLSSSTASHEQAVKLSQQALGLFREAGDKRLEAAALHTVAAAELLGPAELLASSQAAEEALRVSREIGDEAGQMDLLFTLSSARLAAGQPSEALQRAEEAQSLAKKLGDKRGAARAAHAAAAAKLGQGDTSGSLTAARTAAALFRAEADRVGEAGALQTAAKAAAAQGGSAAFKEAAELAKSAIGLFRLAENDAGEAGMQLVLANMLLSFEGPLDQAFKAKMDAGYAAERARALFLLLGDRRGQAQASHLAAQSKILVGDVDAGIEAAMQAVVLARSSGDKWGEASAMRTALGGQMANGRYADGLRMAKEVKELFRKLGAKNVEEAIGSLVAKIQEVMPQNAGSMGPRLTIQPKSVNMNLTGTSVFAEATNCIVWSVPMTHQTYVLYCLELLKFVDDLKNVPGKIAFLVLTRGVMGRHTGEPLPTQLEGVIAATVWAVCRTIRLESPKLQVTTVDIPNSATVHEMTECIRVARYDAGPRSEVSFIVDRSNQLGQRPY